MSTDRTERARPRRATLRDVAQEAGVAVSTASLVYSGHKPVTAETAERVWAAARALGYAGPDPRASSLRQGRSGVVGAVVPSPLRYAFRDPYAVLVFDGFAEALGEMGSSLLLIADAPAERASAALAVDAVVFMYCNEDEHPLVGELAARAIPMVATSAPVGSGIAHLRVDERAAMAAVAQHLHDLGHRRVAHILMPLGPPEETRAVTLGNVRAATYPITRERALGVVDVLGDDLPLVVAAQADIDGGRAGAALLLERAEPPTAIIAQSDLLAVGVIQAAETRGLRVPEDLSVTGFDGVALPWLPHRLTTVDQHPTQKGRAIGDMVRRLLDGEPVADRDFPADLSIGDTTGPPPAPR